MLCALCLLSCEIEGAKLQIHRPTNTNEQISTQYFVWIDNPNIGLGLTVAYFKSKMHFCERQHASKQSPRRPCVCLSVRSSHRDSAAC